jgi:hypothetical protein
VLFLFSVEDFKSKYCIEYLLSVHGLKSRMPSYHATTHYCFMFLVFLASDEESENRSLVANFGLEKR